MTIDPKHTDNRPIPAEEAPASEHNPEECYHRLRKRIETWPETEMVAVNADVKSTAGMILRGRVNWRPFLKHADKFPELDPFYPRQCENFAAAAIHVQLCLEAEERPFDLVTPIVTALQKLKDALFADITALVQRGVLDGNILQNMQSTNGQEALAFNVLFLILISRQHYAAFEGRCSITPEELAQGEHLASQLIDLAGSRQEAPAKKVADAVVLRAKAFSAMVFSYGEVQRVVTFLRWRQGDVEDFAPSIYAGRTVAKKSDDATSTQNAGTAGTSATATTVATGSAAGSNVAATAGSSGSTSTGASSSLIVPDHTTGSLPGVSDHPFKT